MRSIGCAISAQRSVRISSTSPPRTTLFTGSRLICLPRSRRRRRRPRAKRPHIGKDRMMPTLAELARAGVLGAAVPPVAEEPPPGVTLAALARAGLLGGGAVPPAPSSPTRDAVEAASVGIDYANP